jgi:hypothetical protein
MTKRKHYWWQQLHNRQPRHDDKAHELLEYWSNTHAARKLQLKELRQAHAGHMQFMHDLLMHPDLPESKRANLKARLDRGSDWRSEEAAHLIRRRHQAQRYREDWCPFEAPGVAAVCRWARQLRRHAKRVRGNVTSLTPCGVDDHMLEIVRQCEGESRAAMRLARLMRDGKIKETVHA